jgi:hypothetical protein
LCSCTRMDPPFDTNLLAMMRRACAGVGGVSE